MASNRRSREARLLEPLLARRPNELPDNALGPTINDIYQAIAAHKAGHDHDWIYFTKDEIINMWLGAYNPNIVIPAIPGAGVLFDGNIVKIDTSRDYSWLGNHTFTAPIDGTISNATNADKLDGSHASAFAVSGHNHDTAYLGKTATAADSDKVDGYHASSIYRTDAPNFVSLTTPKEVNATVMPIGNYGHSVYTISGGYVPSNAKGILMRVGVTFNVQNTSWYAFGPDSNPASSELSAVVRSTMGAVNYAIEALTFIPVRNGYIFTKYNSSLPTGFFGWINAYVM